MAPSLVPTLRLVLAADAEVLAALVRGAFSAQPATVPPPSALKETAASIAAHLRTGGAILAEVDGAPVGAVLWAQRESALHLSRLSVDPAWRRQNIAHALLDRAETQARQMGLDRLVLNTRLSLTDNRRLFAAAGYVEISFGRHEGFSEPTFVVMERRLPRSSCHA